jgi:hypothetical protein
MKELLQGFVFFLVFGWAFSLVIVGAVMLHAQVTQPKRSRAVDEAAQIVMACYERDGIAK